MSAQDEKESRESLPDGMENEMSAQSEKESGKSSPGGMKNETSAQGEKESRKPSSDGLENETSEQSEKENCASLLAGGKSGTSAYAGKPDDIRQRMRMVGRWAAAALFALLLVYYCTHPALYQGEQKTFILKSGKTYFMMAGTFLLIVAALLPNRLDARWNRILTWCWFGIAPFAIYFSLLHLNATKYSIDFFALNKIALALTFLFLYLVQALFLIITGSVRFSVVITAILVGVLGIANVFVISFRGMALSAADLFSVSTAMTVASEYTYKIDWYIFLEIVCTAAICVISLKLPGGRVISPALRAAALVLWSVVAGSYYYVCCKTDFLEEHDIRSLGFTHQLRYKNYDMIFTTLCTCFYLSVDKPEGYSLTKVEEIAADYVTDEKDGTVSGTAEVSAGDGDGVDTAEGSGKDGTVSATANVAVGDLNTDGGNTGAAAASGGQNGDSGQGSGLVARAAGKEENSGDDTAEDVADGSSEEGSADVAAEDGIENDSMTSKAEENGSTAGEETAAVTPNLVVIMNESFADYMNIGKGLDLSEDNMPFYHSLTENTIKGNAYASIFGGNTPNSEYEFLTGNTMAFLPVSSVAFNLFVRGNLPSIASQLKSVGYETLAIHPYRGTNYRRNIVYPQLGFDTFYTRDDFPNQTYIRSYISDETLADRIISEYEKNQETGNPLFSYNVTIQNHGGYYASNTRNLDMSIQVQNSEVDQTQTNIYVNLIRESDRVLEKLVNYFQEQEEPTILVMFGDHQANLGDDTYEYLIGAEEDLTQEELMEKYKIPFIIWANYDIEEEVIEKTSLNYLYSIMADHLGLPMTGYQEYLLDLSEEVPVINTQGYWGADGEFYLLDDKESPYYEKVNEYNILEYNDILGGDNRYLDFFTMETGS